VHRTLVDGVEGTPKNHRNRTVPIPELVAEVLRGLPRRGPWLFTKYDGPITHKMADNGLKAICKRLGREKFGWHTLRHTYATWLIQQAASLHHVGMLLGHSSEKVTRVYIHLRPEYLQSTVAKLDADLAALGQPAGRTAA
jgi:integrase